MTKTIYMAAAGLAAIAMTSCNGIVKIKTSEDSPVVTKEITVNEKFNGLVTKCGADIEYTDGPAKITLHAPEDIMDILEVKVEEGKLVIASKKSGIVSGFQMGFNSDSDTKLIVSYPGVNNFIIQGSGDITIADIEREEISLLTQGSGDIECGKLNANGLSVLTQGSGDISISDATCQEISLMTQGSGDIRIKNSLSTTLTALSQGSGDITIAGESSHAELSTMGSGDINATSLKCDDIKVKAKGSGDVNTK